MSQITLSSTAAVLLMTAIALPSPGHADPLDEGPHISSAGSITRTLGSAADPATSDFLRTAVKIGEQATSPSQATASQLTRTAPVAKIHTHTVAGRKAATLYVRNIPVLTFVNSPSESLVSDTTPAAVSPDHLSDTDSFNSLSSEAASPVAPSPEAGIKIGEQSTRSGQNPNISVKSLGSTGSRGVTFPETFKFSPTLTAPSPGLAPGTVPALPLNLAGATRPLSQSPASSTEPRDAVWRATALAAKLNELNRDGLDASQITVSGGEGDRFEIKLGEATLVTVDAETALPDSTQDRQEDALQATNRLRRLLGNAAPLGHVSFSGGRLDGGMNGVVEGAVMDSMSGWASWYGPGFNGNISASGEVFNQYALTAAHRTLPFGTRVRVTNVDSGTSVVVRINDRGPYAGDRVLDLSMGAAQVLGLINTGVGMVRMDILGIQTAQRD
jgi:rare lipoprotein A